MKQTGLILLLVLFIAPPRAEGQILQRLLTTGNQQMLEESIRPGISIMRQEFQLLDEQTGRKYNLDSLSYFGYSESLCINTSEGCLVSKSLISPWESDKNICDYPEYKPVLSATSLFDLDENRWNVVSSQSYPSIEPVGDSDLILVNGGIFSKKGLECDSESGSENGWIVWVFQDSEGVSLQSYRQRLELVDTLYTGELQMPIAVDNLRMGLFFITDYPDLGVVRFKLAGVATMYDEEWKVIPLLSKDEKLVAEDHKLVEVLEENEEQALSEGDSSWRRRR